MNAIMVKDSKIDRDLSTNSLRILSYWEGYSRHECPLKNGVHFKHFQIRRPAALNSA